MTLLNVVMAVNAASLTVAGMMAQSDGAKLKMWILYTLAFVAFVIGTPGYL